MQIDTTRFGHVAIEPSDIISFEGGLIGMESCRRWALLADAENSLLGWLQSLDRPDVALAVVSPRRFVADYRVRVASRDLQPLGLASPQAAQILVIVTKVGDTLALNLKAPLVINVEGRRGRQLVAKDDHSVQYLLNTTVRLRKTA
jgi:flagellar assembly factor FliW